MAKIGIDLQSGSIQKEEQAQDLIVGIDLGTTNSLVAYVKEEAPLTIRDEAGKSALLPSVLHFTPEGKILTGHEALEKMALDPEHTVYSVKRLLGKSYEDIREHQMYFGYRIINNEDENSLVKIQVYDRFYTPVELSAEILKALKKRAEKQIGKEIAKAVITVPAYFNDAQRQATRDAGKLAGLDVLRIVNEPTAASLAYGLGLDPHDEQIIAVYDLGGGTFDISILHLHQGIFEVLSTHGDTFLGGDDFDRALINHWMQQHNWTKEDLQASPELGQQLRLAAETAKKALSSQENYEIEVAGKQLSINRQTFEQLIEPLVERTIASCRQAVKDAGKTVKDINRVILVGGSTRVPLVRRRVEAFFGQRPFDRIDPDEVVALGAAVQADILAGRRKGILLLDVTALSLGIETLGGLMDVIIPRNTRIPTRVGRQYTTSIDGQANLRISVYQGERDLVKDNRKLGAFVLRGIPPMPAGIPKIEIHFILNADGILTVKAKELRSGVEQQIDVKPSYGLSEEEMARMLLESIQHAQQDRDARALLEARVEAGNILQATDKFLQQHSRLLSGEEIQQTQHLADALGQAVKGEDKDAIHAAIDALNEYTRPLAERAMDHAIAEAMKGKKIE